MTIERILKRVIKYYGNLQKGRNIYIAASNMDRFGDELAEVDAKQGILITPYLITREGALYELHYYEFDVEVRGDRSSFIGYNKGNTLPKEITENLKPQAIVAMGDIAFYCEAVKEYLQKMTAMQFEDEKNQYPQLQSAQLFYQVFIDSDMQ